MLWVKNTMGWLAPLTGLFLAACGSDLVEPNSWKVDDPPDEIPMEDVAAAECVENSDCGDGRYCHHPESCSEPNYCEEGHEPVSAAAAIAVCGCDGAARWANPGHPGSFAWEMGSLAVWNLRGGEPCDPEAEQPFDLTLRYQLRGDLPDEGDVLVRVKGVETDTPVKAVDENGLAEFHVRSNEWPGYWVDVLFDADGDGECSAEGDLSKDAAVHGGSSDFVDFVFEFDVELGESATVCGGW